MTAVRQDAPSTTPPTYAHLLQRGSTTVSAGRIGAAGSADARRAAAGRSERPRGGRHSTPSPPPKPSPTTSWPRAASIRGRSSRSPPTMPSPAATARSPTAPTQVASRLTDVGPPRRRLDRIVPQSVARARRHSGRRRVSLRPADAAHRARRAHGDQRRRLSDRPRLPRSSAAISANWAPTRPPTSSTSWPMRTPS